LKDIKYKIKRKKRSGLFLFFFIAGDVEIIIFL